MDYTSKIEKIDKHLSEHPKDYQAVIARIKYVSDAIEHTRRKQMIPKLREVAKYRKEQKERGNEKSTQQ